MTYEERKAQVRGYLGKTVKIAIDRPVGYVHQKKKYSLTYPINYGFIPGVFGGDGEELDVYLMGVDEPVEEYSARIIGIVHRHNDVEDKLIAAPEGKNFTQNEIAQAIHFQEKHYETHIEALYEKSAGAVVYTVADGEIKYLLIKPHIRGDVGFPKGHVEMGETDEEAALREIYEETSVKAELVDGYREEIGYYMPNGKHKTVVHFAARFDGQTPHHVESFENHDYLLLPYAEAMEALAFDNSKKVLASADRFIRDVEASR